MVGWASVRTNIVLVVVDADDTDDADGDVEEAAIDVFVSRKEVWFAHGHCEERRDWGSALRSGIVGAKATDSSDSLLWDLVAAIPTKVK